MKVSAAVVTFNHEPFIAQALEGALAQEVDFAYEVVVADDCSTDGTRAILIEYQRRYPARIRLLLHDRNLGCTRNVARLLESCRGEYIALLDGDDYWTHPKKLHRQAAYLDRHPTCAISYHQVRELDKPGGVELFSVPAGQTPVGGMRELLADGIVPTCSAMFRRTHLVPLPGWFEDAYPPDLVLKALAVDWGTFDFLEEPMSVYRLHPGGCWSRSNLGDRFLSQIEILHRLNNHFAQRYDRWTRRAVAKRVIELAQLAESDGDLPQARRYLRRFLRTVPWGRPVKPDQWRIVARVFHPQSYQVARRLREWLRCSSL